MELSRATWPQVEEYLRHRSDVLVPVGSTEQHGPVGLIGTDAICPEAIAHRAAERIGALVAPTLAYGNAQHHLGFPGTVTLRPETFVAVIRDLVRSFVHHGFDTVLFVNGHGGNIAPLQTAFSAVHADTTLDGARPVRCFAHDWWTGPRSDAWLRDTFGGLDGQHGTAGEVSLTWHLHPECVRDDVPADVAPAESGIHDAHDYRHRYPDGRIGVDSRLYSAARGAALLEVAVEDLIEFHRRCRDAAS